MRGQPGDRLLHAALILFAVGVVAIITMFAYPALADGDRAPIGVYILTLATPIGFLLAIAFALRSGRRHR